MGRSRRSRPARLAEKLLQVRLSLGLSQSQMFDRLGETESTIYASYLSDFESGKREPPLSVLLGYARAAGVPVELLIDDGYDLPKHLHEGKGEWVLSRGRLWRRR